MTDGSDTRVERTPVEARDAIAGILVECSSMEEAASRILPSLCSLLGWQAGLFWRRDRQTATLKCVETWSASSASDFVRTSQGIVFAAGVGLPGRVWSERAPVHIPGVPEDYSLPRAQAAAHNGLQEAFAFPVMLRREVEGVFEFYSSGRGEAKESLLALLQAAGNQIALFLQRLDAERRLERLTRISGLRASIANLLSHAAGTEATLGECTSALVDHLEAAFARIWTLNRRTNVLELQASSGLYTHLDGPHSRIPVGAFKIGWIAERRQPHLTNSVPEDPRVTDHAWARREGMKAFAGYPLVAEDQVMGVLAAFSRQEMDQITLSELAPICDAIAQFLHRRRTGQELQHSEALNAAIIESSLDAIVAMSDTGRILEFSPAAELLFGHKRADVLGRYMADVLIPPALREAHRMGLARYLATGEARLIGRRIVVRAMHSDGTELPVELVVSRIKGEESPVFAGFIRAMERPGMAS